MPLDATIAGANANSYLTVADADALAAEDLGGNATAWNAAIAADKEKALIRATAEVDAYVVDAGARYDGDQALLFPRVGDATGDPLAPFIHRNVRRATYEQAAYIIKNRNVLDEAETRRARGLLSFSDMDGGGTIALDARFGRLSQAAEWYLRGLRIRGGSTLKSVPIRSSYHGTVPTELLP